MPSTIVYCACPQSHFSFWWKRIQWTIDVLFRIMAFLNGTVPLFQYILNGGQWATICQLDFPRVTVAQCIRGLTKHIFIEYEIRLIRFWQRNWRLYTFARLTQRRCLHWFGIRRFCSFFFGGGGKGNEIMLFQLQMICHFTIANAIPSITLDVRWH